MDKFLKVSNVSDELVNQSLYKIALICHGTPSPGVWRRFVEEEEAKHDGKQIVAVRFRDKSISWQKFAQVLRFSDGSENIGNVQKKNIFMYFFLGEKNTTLRRSCSFCFGKKNYRADITLGDFWGIESIMPALETEHGVSSVIVNTEHGQELLEKISTELAFSIPTDYHNIEKNNLLLCNCLPLSPKRKHFFRLFVKGKNNLQEIALLLDKKSLGERLYRLPFRAICKIRRIIGRL